MGGELRPPDTCVASGRVENLLLEPKFAIYHPAEAKGGSARHSQNSHPVKSYIAQSIEKIPVIILIIRAVP